MYVDSKLALPISAFSIAFIGFVIKIRSFFKKKSVLVSNTTNSQLPVYDDPEFELLVEANYSNKRNATTVSCIPKATTISLDQFTFTSNLEKFNYISCLLYGIQAGLSWFFFVRFLGESNVPSNPDLSKFPDLTLFLWALSWSIFQLNSFSRAIISYRYPTKINDKTHILISIIWEVLFLTIALVSQSFSLFDSYLKRSVSGLQTFSFLLTILIFFFVGSSNLLPVQIRKTPIPLNFEFKGNVYTSNDQLPRTPEHGASFFSLLTFHWLQSLMSLANKSKLEYINLYKLPDHDLPINSWYRFYKVSRRNKENPLFLKLFLVLKPELLIQLCFIICLSFLKFTSPFFLNRILNYLESADPNKSVTTAYKYCIGLIFFGFIQVLMENQALWMGRKIGIRLRNILVCELIKKSLSLSPHSFTTSNSSTDNTESENKNKSTKKDDKWNSSSGMLINLITTDVNKLDEMAAYFDYSVLAIIQLVIGIIFIYKLMGVSSLAGVLVLAIYSYFSRIFLKYLIKLRSTIYSISDKRLAAIAEMIYGIKAVKLFGWESKFISKIETLRNRQLEKLWLSCKLGTLNWFFLNLSPLLVIIGVFWVYTGILGNKITAEVAFTALSIFRIIKSAFENIPYIFLQLSTGKVSIDRIDAYLKQPEIQLLSDRCAQVDPIPFIGFRNATIQWAIKDKSSDDATSVAPTNNKDPDTVDSEQPLLIKQSQDYGSISTTSPTPTPSFFKMSNINLTFPIGKVSMISGPVGSGKSSILRALLGEMILTDGDIYIPMNREKSGIANAAYVPQEAWLRNASIRDNILFGQEYNQERYENVLFSTALKSDLRTLENGDMTIVGERGVSLSGGQKQRVSLARALYSKASTIIIDDCISAVDSHTASHILKHCFSNNELTRGKTVIVATNHTQLFLPLVDYVVLVKGGVIVSEGTQAEILSNQEFSQLMSISSKKSKKHMNQRNNKNDRLNANYILQDDSQTEDFHNSQRKDSNLQSSGSDEIVEERNYGRIRYKTWKIYYDALGGASFLIISALFATISVAISVFHSFWVTIWVNAMEKANLWISQSFLVQKLIQFPAFLKTYDWSYLFSIGYSYTDSFQAFLDENPSMYYLKIYVFIGLFECAARQFVYFYFYLGSLRASKKLHRDILQSVVHAKQSFFDKTPLGQIVNRFSRDIQKIDEGTSDFMILWLIEFLNTMAVIFIIAVVVPPFLIVGFMMSSYYVFIASRYLNATRELKRMEANSLSPLLSLFSEIIPGITSIRAYSKQRDYIEEVMKRMDNHNRPYYLLWAANRWLCIYTDSAGVLVSFITALVVIYNRDSIGPGLAGFTLSYSFGFSMSLMWVIRYFSDIELGLNSVERISQYIGSSLPQEAPNIIPENRPPASWPSKGELIVENLSVRYSSESLVLQNLNFSIRGGEKVGIVGRTGAGKSTLVHTLLRLVEPEFGSKIMLDKVNILEIGLEDLRRNITIIPQDPVLFAGTIRYNLDLFDEYSDEEVWDALYQAHLVNRSTPSKPAVFAEEAELSCLNNSIGSMNRIENNSDFVSDTDSPQFREDDSNNSKLQLKSLSNTSINELDNNSTSDNGVEKRPDFDQKSHSRRQEFPFDSLSDMVNEGGSNLSLGQRQLVALSRALLRKSKLVIFDEATASVDFETDQKIQTTIRGTGFGNGTMLVIAHRLKSIMDFDRILLFDKGKIAGFGTPFELITTNELFQTICEMSNEFDLLYSIAHNQHKLIADKE
ncbi:hypothetical protein BB560_002555 [Smittium megazygosporum]|uniref:Uncharacterized protein n=1 Tax=Smittium megazygosporum TaxID=133381 RepID=A0A2T9ZEL5_9FUNG|nr:hypothetical protein BB560_002555 [Smittium megazygosporum]